MPRSHQHHLVQLTPQASYELDTNSYCEKEYLGVVVLVFILSWSVVFEYLTLRGKVNNFYGILLTHHTTCSIFPLSPSTLSN